MYQHLTKAYPPLNKTVYRFNVGCIEVIQNSICTGVYNEKQDISNAHLEEIKRTENKNITKKKKKKTMHRTDTYVATRNQYDEHNCGSSET